MKTAIAWLEKKQPEKALELLNQEILQNPENPELYFQRARAYTLMDKSTALQKELLSCLELSPLYIEKIRKEALFQSQYLNPYFRRIAFPEEKINEGIDLMYEGKFEEAAQFFNQDTWEGEQKVVRHFYLSICYYQIKDLDKALFSIEAFKKENPNFPDIYFNEGTVYEMQLEWEKAILAYQQAIQKEEDYRNAYFNLGRVYHRLHRLEEALFQFNFIIGLEPTFLLALYDRAVIYAKLNRIEEALKDMKELLKADPESRKSMQENPFLRKLLKDHLL